MPSLKNLREELSRNNSIVAGIEQSFKRQQAWTGRHPTPPLGQGWDGRTHGTKRCETRRQAGSLLRLGRDGLVQVQKKRHHCRSVAAVCEKPCRRKYCTPTPWACTAVGLRARAASSETSQPAGLRSITSAHHIGCLIRVAVSGRLSCAALVEEGILLEILRRRRREEDADADAGDLIGGRRSILCSWYW
jgi:hypothetical protein